MTTVLLSVLTAFGLAALLSYPIVRLMRKLKARQTILHYVDKHSAKQGVPTMGGIIFIIPIAVTALIFADASSGMTVAAVGVTVAFGILGFLDDFLKIWYKRNLGLRAYQKIIGQVLISLIVGYFSYKNSNIGSEILIPFTSKTIDLGFLVIPFVVIFFAAVTNTVNFTDGLDGLASSVTMSYMVAFAAIVFILTGVFEDAGAGLFYLQELNNIIVTAAAAAGALLGYLLINSFPARIFMGDTGSLALGGLVASLAIFTRLELLVLFLGAAYVMSGLSVIIQVIYFKLTKGKRVFLMAPLHHHFEKKGYHESKITAFYFIITTVIGIICVLLYLLFAVDKTSYPIG